jgi:anti-sigma B factor antagonist
MDIVETREDGTLILALAGRLDSTTAKQLEETLPERMQSEAKLVVDLGELQYVSSAGLRVILKAAKIAKSTGHRLALAALAPQVHEVFQVSGFSALFTILDSRAQALQALA